MPTWIMLTLRRAVAARLACYVEAVQNLSRFLRNAAGWPSLGGQFLLETREQLNGCGNFRFLALRILRNLPLDR